MRSYTLDGAPEPDQKKEGEAEGEAGPARCGMNEIYPFTAAANQSEDNIMTEPEAIRKIVQDYADKNAPKEIKPEPEEEKAD